MAASTVDGAAKTGSKNIDPFKFSVQELCSLHNLKNPRAFCDFGGIDGLVDGLLSHRSRGLGGTATETTPSAPKRSSFANDAPAQLIRAFTASTRRTTAATRSTAADIAVDESAYDAALLYRRREVFLDNHLPTRKQLSFLKRLWMAYNDPVLFLLTAAAAVSLAVGLYQTFTLKHDAEHPAVEWIEGVAILVAIIIIVLVGSVNDWEKARQFKKLNEKQLERDAKVIRFGRRRVIPAADLLVGDVALLEPGDFVPADGILITGDNVTCNEASATGESDPVKKAIGDELFQALASDDNPSAETAVLSKDAFILSGTKVLEGVGTFLVTATGTNSTYGKILATLDEDTSLTPLQGRLAVLAKYIARAGLLISVLLFLGIFIRFCVGLPHDHQSPSDKGKNFVEIVIISLTVLVIAVPEGLPLAVTLSLAFATTRMMKDGNLVRSLNACETMGNATNICSDKTGTLTCNKMKVVSGVIGPVYHFYDKSEAADSTVAPSGLDAEAGIRVAEDFVLSLAPDVKTLLKQSIVLNTTAFESKSGGSFVGSTTESALLTFAKDYLGTGCVDTERSEATILQLVPFDGTRKCMATVAQDPKNQLSCRVFIKGAAEMLLSKSAEIVISPTTDASVQPLRDNDRNLLENAIKSYAGQALRLISLVYRDLKLTPDQAAKRTTSFNLKFLLQDLVFIGIMAIQDPLRPGVWKSVEDCQRAGITVRMVTGDNLLTAKAIAQQCRILSSTDPDDAAMEGSDFRALSPEQMSQKALHIKVLARSSPEDKQKLVSLLKEGGHIVAVTGDGTNDASAMSAADVSFSMGQTGTEVARQASSIIMMTDDFSCIVRAVMWGRAVNDAVKKFLQVSVPGKNRCIGLTRESLMAGGIAVPNYHYSDISAPSLCIGPLQQG